jgi:hypothetical protein
MWEPRRLTTPWAFAACYRDSFTFLPSSNNTTGRRITDMTENIKHNVNENMRIAEKIQFAAR